LLYFALMQPWDAPAASEAAEQTPIDARPPRRRRSGPRTKPPSKRARTRH